MEHEQNSFVVNVFTNGADPARERREKEKMNMKYVEFCREVFRLRQELKQGFPLKEGDR